MVEANLEPLVGLGVELVVCMEELNQRGPLADEGGERTLVAESLRVQPLLGRHNLRRRTILVRSADLHAAPDHQLPAPNQLLPPFPDGLT